MTGHGTDLFSAAGLRRLTHRLAHAARPGVENVVALGRIDSTQESALRLIAKAESENLVLPQTLIVAIAQRRGRGRGGRAWQSPEGGLYVTWRSAGLDPPTVTALPMLAAAAALGAVEGSGIEGASIKWPNDLGVDGRKLAGLLIHARHGKATWAAVGFGINLARSPELDGGSGARAISVAEVIGPGDATDRAEALVRAFAGALEDGIRDPASLVARWRDGLRHTLGESMTVRLADGSEVGGRFAGVTGDGHLRLEVDGSERVVPAGDLVE